MFNFPMFKTAIFPLQITAQQILGRGAGTLPLITDSREKMLNHNEGHTGAVQNLIYNHTSVQYMKLVLPIR